MIKALVFDMDGVIIDSEPIHIGLTVQLMRDLGAEPFPDEIYEFIGVRNEEMWSVLKKRHGISESIEELLARQKKYKIDRFFKGKLRPIDGIPEIIRTAKGRNMKIALATSSPRYFAEGVLENIKLAGYFSALVTADDITRSKPDPEIYRKAAEALCLPPEECAAVEDAYFGVESAKGAGMKCIAFKNPDSGDQDLSRADFVVSSIWDIDLDKICTL